MGLEPPAGAEGLDGASSPLDMSSSSESESESEPESPACLKNLDMIVVMVGGNENRCGGGDGCPIFLQRARF